MTQKSFKSMAQLLIKHCGGPANIINQWHCITRLRFNVNDQSQIDITAIKNMSGVIGALFQGEQFQIVVGKDVEGIHHEIQSLLSATPTTPEVATKRKSNKIDVIFDVISGVFTPLLPAITGGGLLKGILALFVANAWMSEDSSNHQILSFIADAPFHFLPFLVAFSAANKFKTDQSLAMVIAGTLMYPQIMAYAAGEEVKRLVFLGLPIPMNSYASAVLPVILGVLALSYIHAFFKKIVMPSLQIIFVPLVTMVVTMTLILGLVAPLGHYIGVYLETFFAYFFNIAGPVAGLLFAGLLPLIVITGMHYAFFPATFVSLSKTGYDIILLPMSIVSNLAQAGAVLAVFFKINNKEMKQQALSSFFPALFGITEPAIYGVTMRLKKPFYASLLGGGVGGAICGLFVVKAFAFSVPGVMALPTYIEKGTANFAYIIVGVSAVFLSLLSLVISLVQKSCLK